MAQLVVPNAGQMRLIWALGGQLYALNVLGVVNSTAVNITQALTNTIGAAIKTAFTSSAHAASISTTVTLANVGLRDIRTANQAEFLDSGAAVAGTQALELLPPQTALCITLRTASAGPRFRGRVYLPGFTEGDNVAGGITNSATSTPAVAFVAAIQAALVAQSLNLGVIHRPTADPLPVSAGFITTVTSIVCRDLIWDTQRRRAVPGI
jgi:hypothetical protein